MDLVIDMTLVTIEVRSPCKPLQTSLKSNRVDFPVVPQDVRGSPMSSPYDGLWVLSVLSEALFINGPDFTTPTLLDWIQFSFIGKQQIKIR